MAEVINLNYNNFDVNDIVFQPIEVKTPKMKIVRLRAKDVRKSGLRFFSPVITTYGFRDFEDDKKYKLGLTFDANAFISEEARALRDKLLQIQQRIKEQALAENWFAPKVVKTIDSVENIFTDFMKFGKDKATGMPDVEKASYFNLKLQEYESVFNIKIYNNRRQELFPSLDTSKGIETSEFDLSSPPLTLIPANIKTQIRVMFEISSLWFIGGRFGVTCTATEIIIHKAFQGQIGCSIPFDPELDLENNEEVPTNSKQKRSLAVADSDNEEEDDKTKIKQEVQVAVEESVVKESVFDSSMVSTKEDEGDEDAEDEEVTEEEEGGGGGRSSSSSSSFSPSPSTLPLEKKRRVAKKAKDVMIGSV